MKPLELAQQFKRRGAFDEIRKCLLNDFKNDERGKIFQDSVVKMLTELTTNDPSLFKKDRFAFQTAMMREMEKKISLTNIEAETKRLLEETTSYTSKMESELRAILQSSIELPKVNQEEASEVKQPTSKMQKSISEDPVTPLSLLNSILSFSNTATNSIDRMKKKKHETQGDLTRYSSSQKLSNSSMELIRIVNSSPGKSELSTHQPSPPNLRKQSKDGGVPQSATSSIAEEHIDEDDRFVTRRRSSSYKDGERNNSGDKLRFRIDQRVAAFVPDDDDGLREKCYIVIIRKYDPITEKYVVRDPEAIAGEKDTWKISEDKIYDYKRNKTLVERGKNPFAVGDKVYSLYKDRETDETSTEFYEAVIDKIGKHTVQVKFLDDSGDTSRLYYDELFKVNKRSTSIISGQPRCALPRIKLKIKKEVANSSSSPGRTIITGKSANLSSEENELQPENAEESSLLVRKQKRRRLVALLDDDDDVSDENVKHKDQVTGSTQ